jgi:hypothetical protein
LWHAARAGGCSAAVFLGFAEMRGILLPNPGPEFRECPSSSLMAIIAI